MVKETKEQAKAADKKPAKKPATNKPDAEKSTKTPRKRMNPFRAIGGYFRGAWQELKLVHWPNRASTWGLTIAVIMFSLFFAGLILGLDTAFSYLFKEILL